MAVPGFYYEAAELSKTVRTTVGAPLPEPTPDQLRDLRGALRAFKAKGRPRWILTVTNS